MTPAKEDGLSTRAAGTLDEGKLGVKVRIFTPTRSRSSAGMTSSSPAPKARDVRAIGLLSPARSAAPIASRARAGGRACSIAARPMTESSFIASGAGTQAGGSASPNVGYEAPEPTERLILGSLGARLEQELTKLVLVDLDAETGAVRDGAPSCG